MSLFHHDFPHNFPPFPQPSERFYLVEVEGNDYVVTHGVFSSLEKAAQVAAEVEKDALEDEIVAIRSLVKDQHVNDE